MSIKQDLAILFGNYDLPANEFCQQASFKNLESQPDAIAAIAGYYLPEITRLICLSDILQQKEWASEFVRFKPMLVAPESIDVREVLSQCIELEDYINTVLKFQYEPVLSVFSDFFNSMQKDRKSIQDENESKDMDSCIEIYKKHVEKTKEYIARCQATAQIDTNRTQAYTDAESYADSDVYRITPPKEETFLTEYIHSGVVTESMKQSFGSDEFCSNVLRCLEKENYRAYAFPILVKLYEDNIIDIKDAIYDNFIHSHLDLFNEYLTGLFENDTAIQKEYLYEKAVVIELGGKGGIFSSLWNQFAEESLWDWIIIKIDQLSVLSPDNVLYKFLVDITEETAQVVLQYLYHLEIQSITVSPIKVFSSLLENQIPDTGHLLRNAMRKLDNQSNQLKRKATVMERQINSQSQELFSSLYMPLEKLEELAVDLKNSDGNISCNLVANQLIDMLIELRFGLISLDLQPAIDINDWKKQSTMVYDEDIHSLSISAVDFNNQVKAHTLGFIYKNDSGIEQCHAAQVYTAISHARQDELATDKENNTDSHKNSSDESSLKILVSNENPLKSKSKSKGKNKGKSKNRRKNNDI